MSDLDRRFPRYSRLLKFYPAAYRRAYGQQLLQTTADMLDNAGSRGARASIWARLAVDVPFAIAKQQFNYAGAIMKQETPAYIKFNSLVAGALLLPFCSALVANGLDKVINDRTLQGSWLWRDHVLSIWVLRLPEIALLLALGSYLVYVCSNRDRRATLRRLFDLKHLWPVALTGAAAFGVLFVVAFHDSGQCVVHTPAYLASHGQQTWQCFTGNSALRAKLFLI